MRILFDQGTPAPLRHALAGHSVETAYERGWSNPSNGALLNAAEDASFDLFVTTDQNLRYQQDLAGRRLAILVLPTPAGRSFSGMYRKSWLPSARFNPASSANSGGSRGSLLHERRNPSAEPHQRLLHPEFAKFVALLK